jgi:hypothetical protein
MNDIRIVVTSVLTILLLLAFSAFVIAGSPREDQECLRVIARLTAPADWQQRVHAMPRESGICVMAEKLNRERQHDR